MLKKKYTLNQIDQVAQEIIDYCTYSTVLFYGEMGAGKTTLIKSIIKQLGCTDKVTSPTFSIVNEYQSIDGKPIFHFDFYRIEKEEEIFQIGLEHYFNSEGWIFIEWPDNINSFLPTKAHSAKIASVNNEKRVLMVS